MKKTYRYEDTFGKLSSNMISCLFKLFTDKEMHYYSQLGHKFYSALTMDHMWQDRAKKDLLFLPEESSNFKSWKDYYQFLLGLENSLIKGTMTKKFGVKTFRGHQKEIVSVVAIPMANGPFNAILSADADGKVFTWDQDVDEDGDDYFKNTLVIDTKNKIQGMKFSETHKKLIIWDKTNTFYLFDINNEYTPKSPMKNIERFKKISEFKADIESGLTMTNIEIDFNAMDIYMSANFLDYSILPIDHKVYSYHIKDNGESSSKCEFALGHDLRIENLIKTENPHNNYKDFSKVSDTNTFVVTPYSVIIGCSYDLRKFVMTNLYQNKASIPNLYGFDKRTGLIDYKLHIDLDYILNLFKNEKTEEVIVSGLYDDKVTILIYGESSLGLDLKQIIVLPVLAIKPYNIKMAYFDVEKTGMTFIINGNEVVSVDLLAKKANSSVRLEVMNDNTSKQIMNCQYLDRYRVIEAYDNLHLKIYSAKTGKFWFYFVGGSMQVIPKSFVKHPNYNGFHLIVPTRYSIIGAMGNLVREYVFQPKYKMA